MSCNVNYQTFEIEFSKELNYVPMSRLLNMAIDIITKEIDSKKTTITSTKLTPDP